MVISMLRVKYRIEGEKPDLLKILSKIDNEDFSVYEDGQILYLTVLLPDNKDMVELLRRLKPKKCRQSTQVSIVNKQIVPGKETYGQKFEFNQLGYKTKVQRRGYSFFVALNKLIALGNNINKGKELYAYVGRDTLGRSMLVVYLDGFPRNNGQSPESAEGTPFIEE